MRVPQKSGTPANIINHITIVVDASSSMGHLTGTLIKVFDNTVAHLAAQSRANGQETRITVYFFGYSNNIRCVIYDMDVLRTPSINGLYRADGMTALIDATMLSIGDMRLVPQKYGDHSFLTLVLTDGAENDSRHRPVDLERAIATAPENETYGCLVPDAMGVHNAKKFGFPTGNISQWDATSSAGLEEVGRVIRDLSDAYMEGRANGVRGYSAATSARGGGLFKMKDVSVSDVATSLIPLTLGSYTFHQVPYDCRIDEFVESVTGSPYQVGRAYYQLSKAETIQPQKQIAIEANGGVFSGPQARQVLGLPDYHIKAGFRSSDLQPGLTVFVQSTSHNRKLKGGTRLLVVR